VYFRAVMLIFTEVLLSIGDGMVKLNGGNTLLYDKVDIIYIIIDTKPIENVKNS
jgi:hypothetical protein